MSFRSYWKYGDNWISNTVWLYRLLDRTETLYYNLKYGFQNLWKWRKIVWNDRDWDWMYLSAVMRFKLRRMADGCEKYSYHLHKERDIKQMRIVAELLRRMNGDYSYYKNADARVGGNRDLQIKGEFLWSKHIQMQEEQDDEYLSKMIKKMRNWWW